MGTWRPLSPEAWRYVQFLDSNVIEVSGLPPLRFYSVVVDDRRVEVSKRGAPSLKDKDEALFPEIIEMMREALTDKAAVDRLVEAGRVAGGGTPRSKSLRVLSRFRSRKFPA